MQTLIIMLRIQEISLLNVSTFIIKSSLIALMTHFYNSSLMVKMVLHCLGADKTGD